MVVDPGLPHQLQRLHLQQHHNLSVQMYPNCPILRPISPPVSGTAKKSRIRIRREHERYSRENFLVYSVIFYTSNISFICTSNNILLSILNLNKIMCSLNRLKINNIHNIASVKRFYPIATKKN